MTVPAVITVGNGCQHPQLSGTQLAIGDGHPDHWRESFHVKAVAQPELLELVRPEQPVPVPCNLAGELVCPCREELSFLETVLAHGLPRSACRQSGKFPAGAI